MLATKEQFAAYIEVRNSGLTNMFAVDYVIQLAHDIADVVITKDICLDIMKNFSQYADAYPEEAKR